MVTPVGKQSGRKVTFSIELFPPKDEDGEARLWSAVDSLCALSPDFLSVTYGAGGSTRDRTIRIAEALTARTGAPTVAHLTCVGSTREELIEILNHYKAAGIRSILALRGDPTGGPRAEWSPTPGGLDHADQLVELAEAVGGFEIGVAAFPDGHPASHGNFAQDVETLIRKEELGASFATTQFFFEVGAYKKLVESLADRGCDLPIIAGILPITNLKQLTRMAQLSGTPIPSSVTDAFDGIEHDGEAIRSIGIELATKLGQQLIDAGAPGLHFYSMNSSFATLQVARNLGFDLHG
mgnify:CR=1 FL=1